MPSGVKPPLATKMPTSVGLSTAMKERTSWNGILSARRLTCALIRGPEAPSGSVKATMSMPLSGLGGATQATCYPIARSSAATSS